MPARLNIFLILTLFVALLSCKRSDEPDKPAPDKSHRTVLVYMLADNNLGSNHHFDDSDIKEMERGVKEGALSGGHLLVYHNRPGTASGNAPQLLEITPEGTTVVKTYPDDPATYSVDAERMRLVLADMKKLRPADEYGIIFWGHATSWLTHPEDYSNRSQAPRKRSYGNDRDKWMSITALGEALAGNKFAFIYFDCCLMGTVEVAYELRHLAPVIAGSPTELEGEGMPYHLNIAPLFAKGEADVRGAAKNTYEYYDSRPGGVCQMVVINTEALDRLAEASREVFMTQTSFPSSLSGVQHLSKRFNPSSQLYSHCRPVSDMAHYYEIMSANNKALYDEWKAALDAAVIYKASTDYEFNGIRIDRYDGLGSYVITRSTDKDYRGYTQTSWWKDVVSKAPVFN